MWSEKDKGRKGDMGASERRETGRKRKGEIERQRTKATGREKEIGSDRERLSERGRLGKPEESGKTKGELVEKRKRKRDNSLRGSRSM